MVLEGKEIEFYHCLNFIKCRATLIEMMNANESDFQIILGEVKKSVQYGYPKAIHTTIYYEVAFFIRAYLKHGEEIYKVDGAKTYFMNCLEVVAPCLKSRIGLQKNGDIENLIALFKQAGTDEFVLVYPEYNKRFTKNWFRLCA